MDWLMGTMDSYASLGGRKGYLKSRRRCTPATRACPQVPPNPDCRIPPAPLDGVVYRASYPHPPYA